MPCVQNKLYVRPKPEGFTNTTVDASTSAYPVPRIGSSPAPISDRPVSGANLHDWNTYTDDGVKKCVVNCGSHKISEVIKNWHGRASFDFCTTGDCHAAPPTRYRTIRREGTLARRHRGYISDVATTLDVWRIHVVRQYTVGRNSGIITVDECVNEVSVDGGSTWTPITSSTPTYGTILSDYTAGDGAWLGMPVEFLMNFKLVSGGLCDTSYNRDTSQFSGTIGTHDIYRRDYFQLGGDGTAMTADAIYEPGFENVDGFDDGVAVIQTAVTNAFTLSNAYSFADLVADTVERAAQWSLNADKLPFRGDGWRGLGVIVKRWEYSPRNPDMMTTDCGWYDPNAYDTGVDTGIPINTGAVLGAPFAGWPDKTFSWQHPTYTGTVYSYGSSSGVGGGGDAGDETDTVIPPNASFWTDNLTAAYNRPGSWLRMDDAFALRLQKQVERKIGFHAHNYFRPCGADRWMPDTAVAACVSYISGGSVYMESSLAVDSGDLVVFYGSDNHGKVFHVTSSSGTTLTLGAEVTASGVADAFLDYSNYPNQSIFGNGIVCKVRFPSAWPICGKIQVDSAVQDGGNVASTLTAPAKYLVTGDKVDFVAADLADTATSLANLTVTVTDALHFTVPGTLAAEHLKCVKSHGAPLAKWNTDAPTRDFVWQEWTQTFPAGVETWAVVNTQANSGVHQYLTSTPNDDVLGLNKTFPDTVPATTCGGQKIVFPVQYVTDPLWQVPFYCVADDSFSPPRAPVWCAPRVEPRIDVPTSAPALPAGVTNNIPTSPPPYVGMPDCDAVAPPQHSAPWIKCQ
jgi:hypothetical protein